MALYSKRLFTKDEDNVALQIGAIRRTGSAHHIWPRHGSRSVSRRLPNLVCQVGSGKDLDGIPVTIQKGAGRSVLIPGNLPSRGLQ